MHLITVLIALRDQPMKTMLQCAEAFEKAGWKFEGVLRALFIEDGVPHDYYSYAITKFD